MTTEDTNTTAVAGPLLTEGLGHAPPMTVGEFFAEAKRLNLRMLGTPEETRAALDAKDAEIDRLHDLLLQIGGRAHDASTGPAVPDVLWEIRSMAYDGIGA